MSEMVPWRKGTIVYCGPQNSMIGLECSVVTNKANHHPK